MFGLFSGGKKRANVSRTLALHGKVIRYVAERQNGMEVVIGHGGSISVRDGELLVFSSHEIIFRSECRETEVSYLLSGDGVILHAKNFANGGKDQTITAFFVDHIK